MLVMVLSLLLLVVFDIGVGVSICGIGFSSVNMLLIGFAVSGIAWLVLVIVLVASGEVLMSIRDIMSLPLVATIILPLVVLLMVLLCASDGRRVEGDL